MNTFNSQEALNNILLQLQLAAARVSDSDFKRMGAKDLMIAIQDAKKLIEYDKSMNLAMNELISDSGELGIHNLN